LQDSDRVGNGRWSRRARRGRVAGAVAAASCCALATLLFGFAPAASAAATDRDRLIFHVETASGEVLASQEADVPFNPASVIKVATSLWALELLGPDSRFSTTFGYTGQWDREDGRITGDLVVVGGGDPDFHQDNVFLVARELNRMGVRSVDGDLVVVPPFWIGWENGAARPVRDPVDRSLAMADRLLTALDNERWREPQRAGWSDLRDRRGWRLEQAPGVVVRGRTRVASAAKPKILATHQSNPLRITLRRFNVYSNNDIVRIADVLGGQDRLAAFLRQRLGAADADITLSTASGQDRNRMTARLVVALIREFIATSGNVGLRLEELLAVPGCDPGPTREMFPQLVKGADQKTVVGKTGTLTTTDGGVVAFAGTFDSRDRGPVLFAVAATGSGWDIRRWRGAEQAWLIDQMASLGGAQPRVCAPEVPHSDSFAEVVEHADAATE
jgi:D-alanyl-D-alanine carboxypeptidase/D-alanyl-D-alanine-endopeptidase (penicillin-binding protein 4)